MDTKPPDKKLLLMPTLPNAEQQTAVAEEPETTAISFTGPLTRDSLSEYSEAQLIRNAKKVIPRTFRALAKLVDAGDRRALELALQTYSYIGKGGSGVTIVNNVLTQNNNGPNNERTQGVYFESILAKISQEDRINDPTIIDLEAEEDE